MKKIKYPYSVSKIYKILVNDTNIICSHKQKQIQTQYHTVGN